MQRVRKAGLWLALACAIGSATWMMQGVHEAGEPTAHATTNDSTASHAIAMPADATIASPKPFHIDAAIARAAVRDGKLRIALPDGSEHVVAIERQFTDESGHWNVIGRAPTRLGAQAMVLTFGGEAVFGRIPMPDGGAMHVFTAPGDRIVVAPDGGIVPKHVARVIGRTDVLVPSREHLPQAMHKPAPIASGARPARLAAEPKAPIATTRDVQAAPVHSAAPVETTPVSVDVITIYAPDQVTLRGSVAAVQTEVANLLTISNQAHIDSGSRVRFRSMHTRQLAISTTDPNTTVLSQVTFQQPVAGVSLEALRDQYGADLVTVLRPYHEGDWTCGVAYLPGPSYSRTAAMAMYGYSVVNVDGECGTLVVPHELGHNLGAMHDRDTDTDQAGTTTHGAYVYSSGFRTPTFATVMAYRDGSLEQQWIGRFSDPAKTNCVGAPCGIADYSDNVQNFNRMAPAIAAYRGPAGKLLVADVEVVAPYYAPNSAYVPVRLSGAAPAGGIAVGVTVTGGTATQGVDFNLNTSSVTIAAGEREAYIPIDLLPDTESEGDETIALQITAPGGTPISDADAVVTLSESDERIEIRGNLWFPPGIAPPASPVRLNAYNLDGPSTWMGFDVSPPDFAYTLRAPRGMQVQVSFDLPVPFIASQTMLNEVRDARERHTIVERGVRVSGRLRVAPGMVMPNEPVTIQTSMVLANQPTYGSMTLVPPDFAYAWYVPPGSLVNFEWMGPYTYDGNTKPFQPYLSGLAQPRQDVTWDIVLSSLPTLVPPNHVEIASVAPGTHNFIGAAINLEGDAPAGGVSFRYRTVDGTAKANKHYLPVSGTLTIPAGSSEGVHLEGIEMPYAEQHDGPLYFDIVLDQVVGAQLPRPYTRIWIHADALRTGGPQAQR